MDLGGASGEQARDLAGLVLRVEVEVDPRRHLEASSGPGPARRSGRPVARLEQHEVVVVALAGHVVKRRRPERRLALDVIDRMTIEPTGPCGLRRLRDQLASLCAVPAASTARRPAQAARRRGPARCGGARRRGRGCARLAWSDRHCFNGGRCCAPSGACSSGRRGRCIGQAVARRLRGAWSQRRPRRSEATLRHGRARRGRAAALDAPSRPRPPPPTTRASGPRSASAQVSAHGVGATRPGWARKVGRGRDQVVHRHEEQVHRSGREAFTATAPAARRGWGVEVDAVDALAALAMRRRLLRSRGS